MSRRNPLCAVQLTCGHWTRWSMVACVNQELRRCGQCAEIAQPSMWFSHEWQTRCLASCAFARFTGQARRRVHHTHPTELAYVAIDEALRLVKPLRLDPAQGTLDLFTVPALVPPF